MTSQRLFLAILSGIGFIPMHAGHNKELRISHAERALFDAAKPSSSAVISQAVPWQQWILQKHQ